MIKFRFLIALIAILLASFYYTTDKPDLEQQAEVESSKTKTPAAAGDSKSTSTGDRPAAALPNDAKGEPQQEELKESEAKKTEKASALDTPIAEASGADEANAASPNAASPKPATGSTTAATPPDQTYFINVKAIGQYPKYINGCEIISLTMLSSHLGLSFVAEDLIDLLATDPTPRQYAKDGQLAVWGDPDRGFVGDITGKEMGYGVYHGPIKDVLDRIYDNQAVDLTGSDFTEIEKYIAKGHPVVVWTTASFATTSKWVSWKTSDGKKISATFQEHAVLLVGYNDKYVYVNDPITGKKAEKKDKNLFIQSWKQLGQQAVTYR